MHQLLLFLLLFLLLLPHAPAAASGPSPCNRQCGSTTVPYPFGFSSSSSSSGVGGDCPILLTCNATASAALLLPAAASLAVEPHRILSFNSTTSTFLISLSPSCIRTVSSARASLDTASYAVSSRTGLFLRGGCTGSSSNSSTNNSTCNVPSGIMATILRTAQCGSNDSTSTLACVLSAAPAPGSPAAASGEGEFLSWDRVAAAGCEDAVTSAVYAYTAQGVPSIEFGLAEIGWWLPGRCNDSSNNNGGNGTVGGGECAANATCQDVRTPSGAWGHRCACGDGTDGDGFAAGEGCRDDDGGAPGGNCLFVCLFVCLSLKLNWCSRHGEGTVLA